MPSSQHALEDVTYHGFVMDDPDSSTRRILVESPEFGPTQRHSVRVFDELVPHRSEEGTFSWGYDGTGTSRAAAALLAHALDLGHPTQAGIEFDSYPPDKVLKRLREAFCNEVLSQFAEQWRLRRCVILRWAHSWYLQHAPDAMPMVLRQPISAPW